MRRLFVMIIAISVNIIIIACSTTAVLGHTCTLIRLSAHPDYPPYHWRSHDQIVGASIDAAADVFRELGVKIESVYAGPWNRVLDSAGAGSIDLVMALKRTPERQKYLVFTQTPFFENPFVPFVLTKSRTILKNWDDLAGLIGGANLGDRFGEPLDTMVGDFLYIERASDAFLNFKKLTYGRIDYFIHGLYIGKAQLIKFGMEQSIQPLPEIISLGEIHNGFSKKSSCLSLLPKFDFELASMRKRGKIAKLVKLNTAKWVKHKDN